MEKRDDLRAWIIEMRDKGYDNDKLKYLLLNNGYAPHDIDAALLDTLRQNNTPREQTVRIEKIANNALNYLLGYNFFSHVKTMTYVLKNPNKFIYEIRNPNEDADVSIGKAFTFFFVNVLIFSITKSFVSFVSNPGIIFIVVDMIYSMLFSCVALLVFGYIVHRIILFLGGTGKFSDTILVFCYSSAAFAFFGVPYIWLIPATYVAVLLDINLSLIHNTKKTIPLIAMLVPAGISIIAAAIYVLIGIY